MNPHQFRFAALRNAHKAELRQVRALSLKDMYYLLEFSNFFHKCDYRKVSCYLGRGTVVTISRVTSRRGIDEL